jgi:hypothetical protein
MRNIFGAGLLVAGSLFAAVPASAAVLTIDAGRCVSVLWADGGCVFLGNDDDPAEIKTVYDATGKTGSPITLAVIGKIDAPATTGAFGSITYDPGNMTGTWSLPGYLVDYISVKAAREFLLYKLPTPGASGTWSTLGLLTGGGKQPEMSHIQFYGTRGAEPPVVPEPATWAMMIAGFGLVGAAMRRRSGVARVTA